MSSEPRNHFCLIGFPNDGKSVLASQSEGPHLVFNLDNRWFEQEARSQKAHIIPGGSALEMETSVKSYRGKPGTVIFDSVTPLLSGEIARGQLKANEGGQKDMDTALKMKAASMRLLRLVASRFDANTFWIFHLYESGLHGAKTVKQTITSTELDRLRQALTAILITVRHGGKYGVKIEWSRYNDNVAAGHTIWDTEGMWKNGPQKIGDFVRNFQGTEGYNGHQYSPAWLNEHLKEKEKISFASPSEMATKLEVKTWPKWWDRNAWGALIEKAKNG